MIINMNGAKAPETPSPVLQEKTITPETLPTVIGADEGYDGLSQVTVNPDTNLKPTNIRSGKTIFGVNGTFTGETIIESGHDGLGQVLCGPDTSYDGTVHVIKAADWGTNIPAITGSFQCNGRLDMELPHMEQFMDPANAKITSILTKGGYSSTYTLRVGENDVYHINYLVSTNPSNFFDIHIEDVVKHFVTAGNPSQFPQIPFTVDPNTNVVTIPSTYTTLGTFACWGANEFTVIIPENISAIGSAFCYHSFGKVIMKLLSPTPPTIKSSTLNANVAKIIVPAGSLATYQAATYWSKKASIMEEATE